MTRNCIALALTVSLFSTALPADTVELVTGDLLHGTVTEQTDTEVTLSHPLLGEVTLPKDQVQSVLIVSERGGDEATAAELKSTEPAPDQAQPAVQPLPEVDPISPWSTKLLPGWDKHLEAGFNGADGNTDTLNINVGFGAQRENEHQRSKLDLSYFRSDDNGKRSRNEAKAVVVQDWLNPDSPWFTFAAGGLRYDEFTDWETRATVSVGIGKQLIESDTHNLVGRVGLGGSYEFGNVNDLVPEALLGLQWDYKINQRQTLSSHIVVFPSLDDFGESRTNAGAAWTIKIDEADGMSLKFGVDNDYESRTEGSSKHNDVKYYGALVFDF